MSTEPPSRAWIEIRAASLRRNLRTIREAVGPDVRLIPMVKADAYGLGVEEVTGACAEEAWGFGVATVEEGTRLRALGFAGPILVFSPVPPGEEDAALASGLTLCVSDSAALLRLREAALGRGTEAGIHLEVDTGMGRSGIPWERAAAWRERLEEALVPPVRLEGLLTHFHSADEAPEVARSSIAEQRHRFDAACRALAGGDAEGVMRHLSNSAAIFREPSAAGDAVRPGIFLYGGGIGEGLPRPEPVVSVRARVVRVVDAPPGTTQGYGATYRSDADERWATLGIGYGDGLPRALSNRGHALVAGRRAPIVGRISMDVVVVDISGIPGVEPGEVATLVGRDHGGEITLDEVAATAGTISYEILTGWSRRLPRVWIPDDEE